MPLPTFITRTLSGAQLANPAGIAVDSAANRLIVARPIASELASTSLAGAAAFSSIGFFGNNSAAEGFSAPISVVVQAGGHLIVLDSGNGELDRYQFSAANGTYAYDAAFLGNNRSTFDGAPLSQATAITLNGSLLYILDAGSARVVRLDLGTGVATTIVSNATWSQPSGIAADANGNVFVADTFNHRILKFPAGMGAAQVIGGQGTANGRFRSPRGLAFDATGNLFVADSGNQRVQVLEANGAYLAKIGSAITFGSIRGLAFDNAGNLYVSDGSQQSVYVFSAVGAGPILRLDVTLRDFGSVGVGYALDRDITVHNDGTAVLNVTGAAVDNAAFALGPTPLQVPVGGSSAFVARFAPTAAGFQSGVLTLTSDSVSGAATGVVLRGTGITPPLVDACLVLDRSGSMWQSAGAQPKMSVLKTASKLFVDLARAAQGDRIGVVDFDDVATLDMALTPVTDSAPSSRVAARNAIDALGPRGATSIGGGMEQARAAFAAATAGTGRKVMVVVTDGMENTAPFVKGGAPTDPHIDLNQYAGITIYTVALGLGSEVDLGVLASLASTFRGSFYLTEDRWLTLPKFFIEIFGDTIDEFTTLDPEFELQGPVPWEADIDLGTPDHLLTVAVYWQNPAIPVRLEIVTPNGVVLSAASTVVDPRIRFVLAAGYSFFRFPLPLAAPLGRAWTGRWRVRVSAPLAAGQRLAFGVSAIVASSLGIECSLVRSGDATGQAPAIEARLAERGRLVRPDAVSVLLEAPVHSRGNLLASLRPAAKQNASPDYADASIRDRLAWAVAHDKRFTERRTHEIDAIVVKSADGPVIHAQFPVTAVEGAYHYRVIARCQRGALSLRRECAHSFIALAYPDGDHTETKVTPAEKKDKTLDYGVRITPRDALGNLLGPGLASQFKAEAGHARAGALKDAGDGSYTVTLRLSRGDEARVTLSITLRGTTLRWTLPDLIGERKPPRRKPAPPRVDPDG
ncbi:MAG TPA: VWA domain-containing protein [Rubrivivax sp.]|nr:VWA domain-containing protein [Rubrivivax sp.]